MQRLHFRRDLIVTARHAVTAPGVVANTGYIYVRRCDGAMARTAVEHLPPIESLDLLLLRNPWPGAACMLTACQVPTV